MPAKNSAKRYIKDSYYHIYNRGVEKRVIFNDEQDYRVFINYLHEYLSPKDELIDQLSKSTDFKSKEKVIKLQQMNNFHGNINMIAFCLMPNHFHFLVKQKDANAIDSFMNSLATRYTMYFNRKYDRVGSLYQGVYKAVSVTSAEQLLYLTRYIHLQALEQQNQGEALQTHLYSSYPVYLNQEKVGWIHPQEVLQHYDKEPNPSKAYQEYVGTKVKSKYYEEVLDDLKLE